MARICISLGSHLCQSPRGVREASALAAAGHDVLLLGPIFSEQHAAEDQDLIRSVAWRYRPTLDLRPMQSTRVERFIMRGTRRVGMAVVKYTGIQLADSLGYGIRKNLRLVESLPWDLHIGHHEIGCWVSFILARKGMRVGADFEDWCSRDLAPEAQRKRPLRLLRQCEDYLLHHAAHLSTTSHVMAAATQRAYGGQLPEVVYNVFQWSDRNSIDNLTLDRVDKNKPSLYWVSKVIGAGRGLELLFDALRSVQTPVEVHLRGAHGEKIAAGLHSKFPASHGHRLFLHGPLPAKQLLSRISEHDIGLALELSQPASRDLTITLKFFHYLLGGLAVLATNTSGQAEIARSIPDAVVLANQESSHDLASKIIELVGNRQRLSAAKAAARAAAKARFCWEQQAPILVNSVERALLRNVKFVK